MDGLRRGKRWLARALAVTCTAVIPPACSGGSDGTPADEGAAGTSAGSGGSAANTGNGGSAAFASEGEQFLAHYADEVCGMYQPCCDAEGMGFDAGGCRDWFARVTAAYMPDEFVAAEGTECLRALADARAQDPDRCNTVGVFAEATMRSECQKAFVAPARDGAPLGGHCLLSGDCAAAGDEPGKVICYANMCILERQGAAGDGPCYAGGGVPLQQEMVTCPAEQGLYCNRTDNACSPRVGDGERCPFNNACDATSMCVGGICRRLPEEGEPCLNGIPGAGGYCRNGAACNASTLICGAAPTLGEACSETRKCGNGVCIDGECVRSDWQRNLNCMGSSAR
jgi:hypothetical protein